MNIIAKIRCYFGAASLH